MESAATGKILAITLIGVITLTCSIAFIAGLQNQSKLKAQLLKNAESPNHTILNHGKILLNHPLTGAVNAAPPHTNSNNVDFDSGYFYDEWADPNSIHYHDPYYRSYHDQYMQYLHNHPQAAQQYNQQYGHYYGGPGTGSVPSDSKTSTSNPSASASSPSSSPSTSASSSSTDSTTPQYVMGTDGKFVQINQTTKETTQPKQDSEPPKSEQQQPTQPSTPVNTLQPVQRAPQYTSITTPHLGPTEALHTAPRLAEAPRRSGGLIFDPLPGIIPAEHVDRVIKDKYMDITVHGANENRAPPRHVVIIRQPPN